MLLQLVSYNDVHADAYMASRNKETGIDLPPKLQGGVAIGGVAVEAEFFH